MKYFSKQNSIITDLDKNSENNLQLDSVIAKNLCLNSQFKKNKHGKNALVFSVSSFKKKESNFSVFNNDKKRKTLDFNNLVQKESFQICSSKNLDEETDINLNTKNENIK